MKNMIQVCGNKS